MLTPCCDLNLSLPFISIGCIETSMQAVNVKQY